MPPKSLIYCCIPRSGIIIMSLAFGCLGMVSFLTILYLSNFIRITGLTGLIVCLCKLASVIGAITFFYSAYLAYKRRYNPFNYLLYIFWGDIFLDVCSGMISLNAAFQVFLNKDKSKRVASYNASKHSPCTEEQYDEMNHAIRSSVYTILPLVIAFFVLFPLLNKIYFILKLKSYVDYVKYKKEEARPASAAELPHKLPDCRQ